jgi:cell division protein FtsW (lipid II flippase)
VAALAAFSAWEMGLHMASGLLVSDLGTLIYLIPPCLVLAVLFTSLLVEVGSKLLQTSQTPAPPDAGATLALGACLLIPLLALGSAFLKPDSLLALNPSLSQKFEQISKEDAVVTESNMLRLLEFIDPETLANMGTDLSERIAQDHAYVNYYAHRGFTGDGWMKLNIVAAKRETCLNDNVFAVLILAQFGVYGALALLVAYLAVGIAGIRGGSDGPLRFSRVVSSLAALVFACTSLYMMAANLGYTPFTGRNLYWLGLNSLSDLVEGLALVALIIFGLGNADGETSATSPTSPADLKNPE